MKPKIKEGDFYQVINEAISDNRHVEYLREVLRKYDEYKREFESIFTGTKDREAIYRFRVVYLSKKSVWREIEILGKQVFSKLAGKIIGSMGWQNDHMHGFGLLGRPKSPDPYFTASDLEFFASGWEDDPHPTFKSNEIHICDIDYNKQPRLSFIFDFGDCHDFEIEFKEKHYPAKRQEIKKFPRIKEKHGIAPSQYGR